MADRAAGCLLRSLIGDAREFEVPVLHALNGGQNLNRAALTGALAERKRAWAGFRRDSWKAWKRGGAGETGLASGRIFLLKRGAGATVWQRLRGMASSWARISNSPG